MKNNQKISRCHYTQGRSMHPYGISQETSNNSEMSPLQMLKEAIALVALFALITSLTLLPIPAKADQYGTYCISKNGQQRCTIWQWNSEKQTLIKKQITRGEQ